MKKPVHRGVDGHGWRGMEDLDGLGVSARSGWRASSGPSGSSDSAADSWKPEGRKNSGDWACSDDWNSCCRPPFLEGIGSIPPNRRTIHEMEKENILSDQDVFFGLAKAKKRWPK